jgi:thioredoxin 1
MSKVITSHNFETEVLKSDKPVLVDFHAVWCGPCQMLAPIIQELEESRDDFYVGKVDVDQELNLALEYKVQAVPTLLLFKEGKVVNKAVGFLSKEELEDFINEGR